MGQSLSQMYIHLVFGTKGRMPYLTPAIEKRVHAYMAGTLQQYESPALIINSVPDHVHILLNTIQSISGINHHQAEGLTDHNWGHRPQLWGHRPRLWVGIVPGYGWASSPAMGGHRPRLCESSSPAM